MNIAILAAVVVIALLAIKSNRARKEDRHR